MRRGIELFSKDSYREILAMYGSSSYSIIEYSSDISPCIIKNFSYSKPWKMAVTCSGIIGENMKVGYETESSINIFGEFTIPANEQIVLVRLFRECCHDGTPHFNVDDQLIIPCTDGSILRIIRSEAPDHYIKAIAASSLSSIGSVYSLPCDSHGPIGSYIQSGAMYPIHAYSAGTIIRTIPIDRGL